MNNYATESLVCMLVGVNENWKLPIGYFLVASLNSSQKVELIKHALFLLNRTGVKVITFTFDGFFTNAIMELLGCDFNLRKLNTIIHYPFAETEVAVFVDPTDAIKSI